MRRVAPSAALLVALGLAAGPASAQQTIFQRQRATFQAPAATFQAPAAAFQAPAATFQAPAAAFQARAATFQAPAATFQMPAATFQAPAAVFQAPTATFQARAATFQTPSATFQMPAATFQTRTAMFQTPGATFQTPAATFQAPAARFQVPAATVQAPAATVPQYYPLPQNYEQLYGREGTNLTVTEGMTPAEQAMQYSDFNEPAVRQRLNLIDPQIQQLQSLNQKYGADLASIYKSGVPDPAAAQRQYEALNQAYTANLNNVLTPAQVRAWSEMTGQPSVSPPAVAVPAPASGETVPPS